MNHGYDIPRVTFRRVRSAPLVIFLGLTVGLLFIHHLDIFAIRQADKRLMEIWTFTFFVAILQICLSWLDSPKKVTGNQQQTLDNLNVTVAIPVYNEDVLLLDRTLYALFHQTRLPNRVQVVDDGSKIDYSEVRSHWEANHPPQVQFTWVRQKNQGKRQAQARTFRGDMADIFVTLDSDTTLESNAIGEGLKPFVDERVQSVAGLELAYNQNKNWITRINGLRQLAWQMGGCSAQSVMGNVLVNRGTFALYRGSLVRDRLEAYLTENFFGVRVPFGDDSLMTTYALGRGKAVQQISAVQLTMYPEKLGHHLRQWNRWMRSSTIRTFWRLRYLKLTSYGWWVTALNLWLFFASTIASLAALLLWPLTGHFLFAAVAAPVIWMYLSCLRTLIVKRSDVTVIDQLDTYALSLVSFLWLLFVLKPLRLWGMSTCRRTGWNTRSKVEVGLERL